MKRINLAMGIHNHQPVGNFDFVFEEAYQRAYLPFLEVLERHPRIRIAQHYTGCLIDWIKANYPEHFPRLRKLVASGQVEMMTGGYYEPILPVIPEEDARGQIAKLSQWVREEMGYEPVGMWLAERVWEPHLPKLIAESGVKYAVIDDAHFKMSGLSEEQLFGYYVTEHEGYSVNIFPISERLRYTIPFQPPEETINYLRQFATEDGHRVAIFADDGEKFGIWPGTHDHCYKNRWLERFFTALEENAEWIHLMHFSEVMKRFNPVGRVYLPTASYREMMEWALPAKAIHDYEDFEAKLKELNLHERYKIFVRGGFWRNFLAKYPEANHLHKKMLHVSRKANAATTTKDPRLAEVKNHLWAGQCNCPYWHGVFGGLYLPHLRSAVYRELIQAEALLEEIQRSDAARKDSEVVVRNFDFDSDGKEEIILENRLLNLYVAPHQGGALLELDYKPKALNVLDTMARREEGYHRKLRQARKEQSMSEGEAVASIHHLVITKEEGLEKLLHYDWYRRGSLIDHFLGQGATLEQFAACQYPEQGDFVLESYLPTVQAEKDNLTLRLVRDGRVWQNKNGSQPIRVEKTLFLRQGTGELRVSYDVKNLGATPIDCWFGVEFNYALLAGDADDRYYLIPDHPLKDRRLRSRGVVEEVHAVNLIDEWLGLRIGLEFDQLGTLWRFPIETVSLSEAGFERVYQSSVVFPNWKFRLGASEHWGVTVVQVISQLR